MTRVYIGTSGWQYKNWQGSFYPQNLPLRQWLSFYAQHFDTVEVNSSFYRQTKASTFKKWQKVTSEGFTFSIKGNHFITHIKRLKDVKESVGIFFNNASVLIKRGPLAKAGSPLTTPLSTHIILWQLPPSLKRDEKRLNFFLKLLPKTFRHAFEFRQQSWVNQSVWKILIENNAACVFQDWHAWPIIEKVTADFVYIRLHGREQLYTSNYSDEELNKWAKKIKTWLKDGKDVYAYFNNDAHGFAVVNAKKLNELVSIDRPLGLKDFNL